MYHARKLMENNLRKAEFDVLKSLIRNKEPIIQKADKDNTVVLLNRKDYICKMKLILADTSKFKKIQIDDSKVLNHLIHMENEIVKLLKKLKEEQEISDKVYNESYPTGSRPGIFYGFCKLEKNFLPVLEPLTYNQNTIKHLFSLCEELKHFNMSLIMTSFDAESLFTNIPLSKTIGLCVQKLFEDKLILMVCPGLFS